MGLLDEEIRVAIRQKLTEFMPDYHCLVIDGTSNEHRYFLTSKEGLNVEQLEQLKAINL